MRAPELIIDWVLSIEHRIESKAVRIAKLKRQIGRILATFESNGLSLVDLRYPAAYAPVADPNHSREVQGAKLTMFEQGFRAARVIGSRADASHTFFSSGFWGNIQKVNELVVKEAEANRSKLMAAEANERHLFIYLDSSHADAELAFSTGGPRRDPPDISQEIDVVWLATRGYPGFGNVNLHRLARVRRPATWETLDPSPMAAPDALTPNRLTHQVGRPEIRTPGRRSRLRARRGLGAGWLPRAASARSP